MDQRLRHTDFFTHLAEFGYFSDLEGNLPKNFSSVFEIARVLEDESSELFARLSEVLTVSSRRPPVEEPTRGWRPNRNLPVEHDYDIDFIRSVSEVNRVLPTQHALPEEVFMRRLSRRELLRRIPRTPVIVPFGNSSTEYAPNHFKQKVYLLLDTSASMVSHHRFQMAKATAYVFLKRNLRELGHVYFRTFDREISPLHNATDLASLQRLIRHVMRLRQLGNGTAMERAILTACEDIRRDAALSGAEILMITDGAAHLDRTTIMEALGSTITINTIKIGDATVALDHKILADEAARGNSPESHALARARDQIRHLEFEASNASTTRAERIRSEIASLRRQCERMEHHIMEHMEAEYGREIESLSRVFVNIEDIATDEIFRLTPEQIRDLRLLVEAASEEFRGGLDGETLREVALLYEHISMLIEECDGEGRSDLETMQKELDGMLDNAASSLAGSGGVAGGGLTRDDLRDLGFIMQHRSFAEVNLAEIIRDLLRRAARFARFSKIRIVRRARRKG